MVLEFQVPDGRTRRAAVWVPPDYTPQTSWPLVVALHGYGERGDDLEHVQHGFGKALRAHPERFPALVLLPQCPTDLVWVKVDQPWAVGHGPAEDHLDAALDAMLETYPVDRTRITLTGLSMGGFATWVWGAKRADHFQRFLAVCGGGLPELAPRFGTKPFWAIHGDADDVVPAALTAEMVGALRAAGGRVRHTIYAGVAHDSWSRAYADAEIARFLVEGLGSTFPGLPSPGG